MIHFGTTCSALLTSFVKLTPQYKHTLMQHNPVIQYSPFYITIDESKHVSQPQKFNGVTIGKPKSITSFKNKDISPIQHWSH